MSVVEGVEGKMNIINHKIAKLNKFGVKTVP